MPTDYTPSKICALKPNQVFVFGANLAGNHGAGAARQAMQWGAKRHAYGRMGQTYGIPTRDCEYQTLPLHEIVAHVSTFFNHVRLCPNDQFLVTRIGCGLAGYTDEDIAGLFMPVLDIPYPNVLLPIQFHQAIHKLNRQR